MNNQTICGIYKITSPTDKIYIGQSVDIFSRWSKYNKENCKSQRKLYRSFVKYGANKHQFEILTQCKIEQLNELEKYYINLYQTFNSNFGLNLQSGGGNYKISEETKLKMSVAHSGKTHSQEHRTKNSISKMGNTHTLGFKHSNETIAKMVVAKKNISNETRAKMSEWQIGKKHSKETMAKISKSLMGRVAWNKGKSKNAVNN